MDILLLITGIVCLLVGLVGAVLPLPGPPLSFAGMIALQYSRFADFGQNTLIVFGVLTVVITVLDYYVPIWGTKKFGGSKWGAYGSAIGLVAGLFLGPFGIFIGAFAGAFLGEFLNDKNPNRALKAAFGSFIGLMAGMAVKVILCLVMLVYSGVQIFQNL
jgi:uncharacterized protein YqgC (DUF456 family)